MVIDAFGLPAENAPFRGGAAKVFGRFRSLSVDGTAA
jgi:hypothetical protein